MTRTNDGNYLQILRGQPDVDFVIPVNNKLVKCSTKSYYTGFLVEGNDQILFGNYGDYLNVFDGGFKIITEQEFEKVDKTYDNKNMIPTK